MLKGIRVLVVDNYDSFTYNLAHILESILNDDVDVMRVDRVKPESLAKYDAIIFSPGPGLPSESANLLRLVGKAVENELKILGVCLGHQALAECEGRPLQNLPEVYHGVSHEISISGNSILYRGIPEKIFTGRYHSWAVDAQSLSAHWLVTATDEKGLVMSMEHRTKPIFGIQYHPESVLTPLGPAILENFLKA
ncbi:MAG: aminodeoxychorismate/anthranilate synthase component II [Flavobacteriales bacterium]|nr:aminodeoxychorismate/anthranilate synthase component II [Flavobacteriales bacterium]